MFNRPQSAVSHGFLSVFTHSLMLFSEVKSFFGLFISNLSLSLFFFVNSLTVEVFTSLSLSYLLTVFCFCLFVFFNYSKHPSVLPSELGRLYSNTVSLPDFRSQIYNSTGFKLKGNEMSTVAIPHLHEVQRSPFCKMYLEDCGRMCTWCQSHSAGLGSQYNKHM